MFEEATKEKTDHAVLRAAAAARKFRHSSLQKRRDLLHAIADGLDNSCNALSLIAMRETNLPESRLNNEIRRTCLQLRQYGDACAGGDWMDIRIDTAGTGHVKTDLRKMQLALGPVVVFGASNFPFAYSTAGGDTACAFAAGCPVIVKAHPAHPETSERVAEIIRKAIAHMQIDSDIFWHLHGSSFALSEWLVKHPGTAAVGFTGSFTGGKQLYDWAAEREVPIPVFSEMGSTNPVFMLPRKLQEEHKSLAEKLASSITTNAGQFCTKPGLIVALNSGALDDFVQYLTKEFQKTAPQKMLHAGIAKAYETRRSDSLDQSGVSVVASTSVENEIYEGQPYLAAVSASKYLENPILHEEVFGPYSLIVKCDNLEEMIAVAASLDGKLTATIMGHEDEIQNQSQLLSILEEKCGRLVLNGVPTGVTVCWAMHHGGPFPATTDSRYTSVGPDGIRRFTRALCYQNWPQSLLPEELQNANPLGITRMVNGEFTKKPIEGG